MFSFYLFLCLILSSLVLVFLYAWRCLFRRRPSMLMSPSCSSHSVISRGWFCAFAGLTTYVAVRVQQSVMYFLIMSWPNYFSKLRLLSFICFSCFCFFLLVLTPAPDGGVDAGACSYVLWLGLGADPHFSWGTLFSTMKSILIRALRGDAYERQKRVCLGCTLLVP